MTRGQKQTTDQGDSEADSQVYYHNHRTNKNTILHKAVVNENFDVALWIAERYKHLVNEQDEDGMTALQLLACKSWAFQRKGVLAEEKSTAGEAGCCRVPYLETIQEKRRTYESAMMLARLLIKEDKSWIVTKQVESQDAPRNHAYKNQCTSEEKRNEKTPKTSTEIAQTPLFLAIKHGCFEIVEEILKVYPWAVEHIDHEGRTILHVAIKYRQKQVLDHVKQMGLLVKRLERKLDKKRNTILHMVGEKTEDRIAPESRSPAFELQDKLFWYEHVWGMIPRSYRNTLNQDKKTAQKLFDKENEELRIKARDWLQRRKLLHCCGDHRNSRKLR